jgi:hypothetical protein
VWYLYDARTLMVGVVTSCSVLGEFSSFQRINDSTALKSIALTLKDAGYHENASTEAWGQRGSWQEVAKSDQQNGSCRLWVGLQASMKRMWYLRNALTR